MGRCYSGRPAEAPVRPEDLVGALLKGAVGGRGKKGRGAIQYLTGGRGSLINASTLLTAAGLVWGAYEAATQKSEGQGATPPPGGPVPPAGGTRPPAGPPPIPGAAPAPSPVAPSAPA